jgi:N6-L-threonylcarbamoyladenine synthase
VPRFNDIISEPSLGVYILAIESSCDDTSAAVLLNRKALSNVVASQSIHEEFGGVVPELASRAHQVNIVPVVDAAIKKAGITMDDLGAIAYTSGPGLLGSLLVGTSFAKSLAYAKSIPLIEVNHMKAHILAHFIENADDNYPEFPFLCLTVSGGHTQIVKVSAPDEMVILSETIDDAAGEAFDKIAKIMGLGYPGGPVMDKLAQMGDPCSIKFPISNLPDEQFSFSGLKTSVLYYLQKRIDENPDYIEENKPDLCASVQFTIVQTLIRKLEKVAKKEGIKTLVVAGGVSANSELRRELTDLGLRHGWNTFVPEFQYCTDNAAMIGVAGYVQYLIGARAELNSVAKARIEWGKENKD